jgi:hypothetical protein
MTKINMTEDRRPIKMSDLLADREKGSPGPWDFGKERRWLFRDNLKHDGHFSSSTIMKVDDDAFRPSEQDASRIARLPDLEAAYIEAVEALKFLQNVESFLDGEPSSVEELLVIVQSTARTTLEKIHVD